MDTTHISFSGPDVERKLPVMLLWWIEIVEFCCQCESGMRCRLKIGLSGVFKERHQL